MAIINLPEIRPANTQDGKIEALYDAYFMLRKWIQYGFSGVLDSSNIDSIRADKIDVREGKIQSAQIEDLIVGNNVTMGPNAYITWDHVTNADAYSLAAWEASDYATYIDAHGIYTGTLTANQINVIQGIVLGSNATIQWSQLPSLPSASQVGALPEDTYIPPEYTDSDALRAWRNSGYATYIDSNGVYSGKFTGGMFRVNPLGDPALESGIEIGGWTDNDWHGMALSIRYSDIDVATVFESDGVPTEYYTYCKFRNTVQFSGQVTFNASSDVDFSGANVTGLTAKFA